MAFAVAGGAAGGILGGVVSGEYGKTAARAQRRFIERMRSTAYQATMADMRAAGLNPILAYKTGPTPIGSAAMGITPDFGQALASGVNSAVSALKGTAERKQIKAKTSLTRRQALTEEFKGRTEADRFSAQVGQAQVNKINADTRFTNAASTLEEAKIPRAEALMKMDMTKEGQFFNQGTTVMERATGALKGTVRGTISRGTSRRLK